MIPAELLRILATTVFVSNGVGEYTANTNGYTLTIADDILTVHNTTNELIGQYTMDVIVNSYQ